MRIASATILTAIFVAILGPYANHLFSSSIPIASYEWLRLWEIAGLLIIADFTVLFLPSGWLQNCRSWITSRWLWHIVALRRKQKRNPSHYLYLCETKIVFLPTQQGIASHTWQLTSSMMSQLLFCIRIDRYQVDLESTAVPSLTLKGIRDNADLSYCWSALQGPSRFIAKQEWPLDPKHICSISEVSQSGTKLVDVCLTVRGFMNNKQVFSVRQCLSADIEG